MTIRSRGILALALGYAVASAHSLGAQARLSPPSADSGLIAYDDDGLRIHSPDRRQQLKIHGYFVADMRQVLNDTADGSTNGLAIRRARVFFDANLNKWVAVRVMFDVGPPSSSSPLQDAFADIGLGGSWWVRAGKQKTAAGLDRYMSISAQLLPERSITSNLSASRDVGILLTGGAFNGLAEVSLGVFNGAPDGSGSQDTDPNDDKDVTYRVWFKPIKKHVNGVEQGFGFALHGSTGIEKSPAAAGARLPTYKSPAQISFFSYNEAGGVRAAGRHTRNGAFTYLHEGPFGATAEWYANSQVVTRAGTAHTVSTGGWVGGVQYSLSGESSAQEGLAPLESFNPEKGHFGAWQIGARAAHVRVGDEAFPVYADSTVAPHGALELGIGLNWYMTRTSKVQIAYEHTTFEGGAKTGNRRTERYVQLRWQAYF